MEPSVGACSKYAKYHEALCRLGAQLKRLALEEPEFFDPFRGTDNAGSRSDATSNERVKA